MVSIMSLKMENEMEKEKNGFDVSVVIPCLNEERSIGICIKKALSVFARKKLRGEIVISDNGSIDRSVEIAQSLGARVVHSSQKGYGNALRKGIEEANSGFIIIGDADDSYDFSVLDEFVEKLHEGCDLVMGTRLRGKIMPGAMPWHHRWIGNPLLTSFLNILFKSGISDAHCGMRGFTKDAYQKMDLRTTGMEFASEMVIKAAKLRLNITEIPITYYPDKRGRLPHLKSFHDGWRHLRFMLMLSPNYLFMMPGILLVLAGISIMLFLFTGPLSVFGITLDVHTMLFGMVFTLLGLQVIFLGMFAKIFSYTENFSRNERSLEKYLKRFTLETGLIIGSAIGLLGFLGNLSMFIKWARSGFGPFAELRMVILSSTLLLIGIETLFASFFLSMLGISRDVYIGDYDRKAPEGSRSDEKSDS